LQIRLADIFARISVSLAASPGDGAPSPGAAAPNGASEYSSRNRRKLASTIFLIVGVVLLVQHELETNWQAESAKSAAAAAQENSSTDTRVTLLSIPKIKLEAAILEGTTRKSLMLAPGHLENTARPGDPGNSVIAGHRDTFFRHIHELNKGDEIYVRRGSREYHYVVISKAIVAPDDIAVTYPTKDTRLTLVTCYPTYYIGPAPKRLVVVATLRPGSATAASEHATDSAASQ
jgi:sortase A